MNRFRHLARTPAMIPVVLFMLAGCGGGGGGDAPPSTPPSGNVGAGWVSIIFPTPQQTTSDQVSIAMSGEAFISPSCQLGGCPDREPTDMTPEKVTGVVVTWLNNTTGTTGSTSQGIDVVPLFNGGWLIGHSWSASIPLALGSNRITVSAADAKGNAGTASISIHRIPDVTAPAVIATSPSDQAQGVSVAANLSATFSEPMDPASIDGTSFMLFDSNNNLVPGTVTVTGRAATFDPNNFLGSASSYTARITSSARDASGNNTLASEFVWTFSTGPSMWLATLTNGAPGYSFHTAVWSGTRMIVWGQNGTGASYDPATDSWQSISSAGAPSGHTNAVWTGSEMIILDSQTTNGGRYRPTSDSWHPNSTVNAPSPRNYASAIWTGIEMIIWGGFDATWTSLNSGASYNPLTDTWRPITTIGAPPRRGSHSAVWTGTEMIIWGGGGGGFTSTGARYNPATNSWRAIAFSNSPADRIRHSAVWTGTHMIIWGGDKQVSGDSLTNTGASYDPSTNTWQATTTVDSPSPRSRHTAIWTGSEMIVWGGVDSTGVAVSTGGRYDPVTNRWSPLETTGAPTARPGHTSVWTGSSMIVWGGDSNNTGGRFIP